MLDTHGDGVPPEFVGALSRAVAHYGMTTLDRSPELEESLLWIYKSHQRVEQQIAPITRVLQRRLAQMEAMPLPPEEAFRTLLDRMISITRGLFPAVSDLARELRYRCFDKPLFDQARKQIYADAESHLDYLPPIPTLPTAIRGLRALIECPQPLASLLSGRFAAAPPSLQPLDAGGDDLPLLLRAAAHRLSHPVRRWALLRFGPIRREREAGPYLRVHAEYHQLSKAVAGSVCFPRRRSSQR